MVQCVWRCNPEVCAAAMLMDSMALELRVNYSCLNIQLVHFNVDSHSFSATCAALNSFAGRSPLKLKFFKYALQIVLIEHNSHVVGSCLCCLFK